MTNHENASCTCPKCRCSLHQAAELDGPREIARRGDDERENDRDLIVAGAKPGQTFLALHDRPPVAHDVGEARSQTAYFVGFAGVQRDPFGILPKPHERKTEIGLEFLLVKIEPDQRPADEVDQPSADDGIDERDPHHVAGNA